MLQQLNITSILCFIIITLGSTIQSFGQTPISKPEQMPRFPGCTATTSQDDLKMCSTQKLIEFISKNVKYPKKALKDNTTGTAVIKFIVSKDGTIKDATIARDLTNGCGAEALRVVNEMNKQGIVWTPGQEQGKIVDVLFHLPISFQLPKE